MQKANYKYYLANGAEIEYVLSPDSSLVKTIDHIVCSYIKVQSLHLAPNQIWVKPNIATAINKECVGHISSMLTLLPTTGFGVLRIQTLIGPITVVAKSDLEFPLFFGSEQEYKDNSFSSVLTEILSG